jgi:transcriptional regulator with XRE-family HTH domain
MKERVLKIIKQSGLSPTKFAEEIGVQPSAISHIMSGRNNPSYEFIIKILKKYPRINAEWLLMGNGAMYKSIYQTSLFNSPDIDKKIVPDKSENPAKNDAINDISDLEKQNIVNQSVESEVNGSQIERIVIFYEDKTFKEYYPKK